MTEPDPTPFSSSCGLDPRRRRILFRANHRGTKEADRLIGGYVTPRLTAMTDAELDMLEALMQWPDPDLADWLSGRCPIPEQSDSPLMRAMRRGAGS